MADDERNEPDFDGFPPIQSTVSDEFSKWQLWGEDLIDQLKHDLKGEVFDTEKGEAGQWVIPKDVKPMLNESGINATISLVRMAAINKFALLSNLDKPTIYKILLETSNELVLLYMEEHEKFKLQSPIQASFIITKIFYFMHNALLMAADGGMREYLKTTVRELRQYSGTPKDEKKGGGLFGLFGKGDK